MLITGSSQVKGFYQVKGMAVWNEQAHRKLQMHWLVQMTHQWLNQHTQLQVKQAMPVDREQKIHRLKNRFRKTCATYSQCTCMQPVVSTLRDPAS